MASPVVSETIRIATFSAPLSRDGPGLLLRDVLRGEDDQIDATLAVIEAVDPDILVLTEIDWDRQLAALTAFNAAGPNYPHVFATQPNSGRDSGFDLDANGRLAEDRDGLGYGRFTGDGGMAILSRWPMNVPAVQDLTATLWKDLPGVVLPVFADGRPFPSQAAIDILPVSTTAHWIVPVMVPGGPFDLMVWSATPPVFDGPEDANGLRNKDELLLWVQHFGDQPFVLAGNANLDPVDGDGLTQAMAQMLAHPRLIDPLPRSAGGVVAADPGQAGDPSLDTADWPDDRPGNLRVSYVLPSAEWQVVDAGVFWPAPDDPLADLLGPDGLAAGPHRLVWVDLRR